KSPGYVVEDRRLSNILALPSLRGLGEGKTKRDPRHAPKCTVGSVAVRRLARSRPAGPGRGAETLGQSPRGRPQERGQGTAQGHRGAGGNGRKGRGGGAGTDRASARQERGCPPPSDHGPGQDRQGRRGAAPESPGLGRRR